MPWLALYRDLLARLSKSDPILAPFVRAWEWVERDEAQHGRPW